MVFATASLLTLILTAHDPIDAAIESYKDVVSYQVTLRSTTEEIKYYYKKPGLIRIDFISPHRGAVLVFDPFKKEVKLRPFSFLKFFVLTFSPDNGLIKSSKGHRIDESDIGTLLREVKKLQTHGEGKVLADETISGKLAVPVSIEGQGHFIVGNVHKYLLWLDKETFLPLKASSYSLKGELIEEVVMDDLQLNPEFTDNFFEL